MKWDVKTVVYSFLAYVIFGVSYLFSDGTFVLPVPALLFALPAISLIYFFTVKIDVYSIMILFTSLSNLSNFFYLLNPNVGDISVILAIMLYVLLGFLMLKVALTKSKTINTNKANVLTIILLLSPLLLLGEEIVSLVYLFLFLIVGLVYFKSVEEDETIKKSQKRLILALLFNSAIFLVTWFSQQL